MKGGLQRRNFYTEGVPMKKNHLENLIIIFFKPKLAKFPQKSNFETNTPQSKNSFFHLKYCTSNPNKNRKFWQIARPEENYKVETRSLLENWRK